MLLRDFEESEKTIYYEGGATGSAAGLGARLKPEMHKYFFTACIQQSASIWIWLESD